MALIHRTGILGLFLLLVTGATAEAQLNNSDTSTLRRIGDVLHIALPATAGGSAAIKKDWEGLLQFSTSFGATAGTLHGLKQLTGKSRPDETDARSYPSGHAAMSFSGASFILTRYGKKWGIPAMAAAGFTGYTRIKGQKHYEDDVIAGAGIGLIYNLLLVRPMGKNVFLKPHSFSGGGAGFSLGFDPGTPGTQNHETGVIPAEELQYRVEFEFGAVDVRELDVQAPAGAGTLIPMERGEQSVTPTARFKFNWQFRKPHEFEFFWAPFEGRDFEGVPDVDAGFAGVTFPAGQSAIARYRFNDVGLRYRYELIRNRWVDLRLGGALSVQETKVTIIEEDNDLFAEVQEHTFMPLVHGRFAFHFTPTIHFTATGNWMQLPDEKRYSGGVLAMRWQVKPRWDLNLGYRGVTRQVTTNEMFNRFSSGNVIFGVGYSF